MKKTKAYVVVRLTTLKALCLSVDYGLPRHARDKVESLSLALAHRYGFDTHEFRLSRGWDRGDFSWNEASPDEEPCDHEGRVVRGRCERCGEAGLESDAEVYERENPR